MLLAILSFLLVESSFGGWDCHRQWPSIELFLPFQVHQHQKHSRFWELETIFLQTYLFFWPVELSKTSLNLIYDQEKEIFEHVVILNSTINDIKSKRNVDIKLTPSPEFPFYHGRGYDRQQFVMFWADNYTSSSNEFIGFVDSDAAFITYVDREDLFENGKPVVNARAGYHQARDGSNDWSIGSQNTLKTVEPFRCMSYFPVIIHRKHLKVLREHISKLHNMTFNEVYDKIITNTSYSQFGIMCTFLWHQHRDEYQWYVEVEDPGYTGTYPPGQENDMSIFPREYLLPKPRVCTHAGHRACPRCSVVNINAMKHIKNYNNFLLSGYCYGPPFPHNELKCQNKTKPYEYHFEMYNFDYIDYTKLHSEEDLNRAALARYDRIKSCNFTYNAGLLTQVLEHS
jgi:hypothetical protein